MHNVKEEIMTQLELKRSSAAYKAWVTRKANASKSKTSGRTAASLTATAKKAWATRRANAGVPSKLVSALRPTTEVKPAMADNLTKGLRKRSITAKTVVEKINSATAFDYYAGSDRSVLVMYNK
jgi:hypothetical protein